MDSVKFQAEMQNMFSTNALKLETLFAPVL